MKYYRNSGAHRRVMPNIYSWCDEAAVVHWETDSYFPTWEEIHRRMIAQGHTTRLSQPTAAQLEKKFRHLHLRLWQGYYVREKKFSLC